MKITTAQYAKSLYELTEQKSHSEIDGVVAGFIKVLQKNRRIKLAPKIIEKFSEIYNKKNGIVEAEVITSRKLESYQVIKLEEFIKNKYQAKEVVINNKIDESIKGGIVIKVGDEILDASLARQLQELQNMLKK